MNTYTTGIGVVVLILLIGAGFFIFNGKSEVIMDSELRDTTTEETPVTEEEETPTTQTEGKLKVVNFVGVLTEVNTGCAYDAECYVIVDGKHITTMRGWSRDIGGTADLDILGANIGQNVHVYAQDLGDGTYTLYGSEGFYVRLK